MESLSQIVDMVRRGDRIDAAEAVRLWREAPLWLLGSLAAERKRAVSGDEVYYNRNIHIEPSNICVFDCEFCSFRRAEGDADAWSLTLDQIEQRAREAAASDPTEVHIVGGVHPDHDLDFYCEAIRRVKRALPSAAVKAFTAVELLYMIRKAGLSVARGLERLRESGMEAIPGGGAEIFDERLRERICPEKGTAEEWLAVHRIAHRMGIPTNATMLYGHVETIEQRVDHLDRLRRLQDEAPGFDAFIPLKYRSRHNRLSHAGECGVDEDLRTMAMCRIFLDNIPHIKAYWVAYGKPTAELALSFGADDLDGTIDDSTKIYSMAGGDERPSMSVGEIESVISAAGMRPVERDTHYRPVAATRQREISAISRQTAPRIGCEPVSESSKKNAAAAAPAKDFAAAVPATPAPTAATTSRVSAAAVSVPVPAASDANARPDRKPKNEKIRTDNMENTDTKPRRPVTGRSARTRANDSRRGLLFKLDDMRRRYPVVAHTIYIMLTILCMVVVLSFGLDKGTRHDKSIVVPNFVGMDIDDARREADRMDLRIVVQDSIFDSDLAGGTVVEQLPRHGDRRAVEVKPGRKIYLTINAYNRRMVTVPYVAKQSLRQAKNQLERAGLTIRELVYETDMVATDYVLREEINGRQIMAASTPVTVPYGTGVTLYVSCQPDRPSRVVPKLIGMRLSQAQSTLWDNGLNVGKVEYDASVKDFKDRREAKVYKQSLHQNQGARPGARISLWLTVDGEAVDKHAKASEADALRYEQQRRREEQEHADSIARARTVESLMQDLSDESSHAE